MGAARKTDPGLWGKVKDEITKSDKGGREGQWSARKAQMAVQEYKKRGGAYEGRKRPDNDLHEWTEEDWGTRSGKKSTDSGERYLPKKARQNLSEEDYARTTQKKRKDTKKGKQFSGQPSDVRDKTAPYRKGGDRSGKETTKRQLMDEAKERGVEGRSKMNKNELLSALSR